MAQLPDRVCGASLYRRKGPGRGRIPGHSPLSKNERSLLKEKLVNELLEKKRGLLEENKDPDSLEQNEQPRAMNARKLRKRGDGAGEIAAAKLAKKRLQQNDILFKKVPIFQARRLCTA